MARKSFPGRIVTLSGEAAEFLWRIGAWNKVVGISAYCPIAPEAARKPVVSGFSSALIQRIAELQPDLVITYSDVQADLTARLIRAGLSVLATNQRTLEQTQETLLLIGRLIGREKAALKEIQRWKNALRPVRTQGHRPRVYFEEWPRPLITGINWVMELIERAGGEDIFPDHRLKRAALDRVVKSGEVIAAKPEIIVVSWCGKKADLSGVASRPGWKNIPAVQNGAIFEIPSADILQPGVGLERGYAQLRKIISKNSPAGD
jgi:iron complex transport system substrate-binding protein